MNNVENRPSVFVLDCTLRDGGYINDWNFSNEEIIQVITSLKDSKVDIIELGYLNNAKGKKLDSTIFDCMNTIDSILEPLDINAKKVIMINLGEYDIDHLPQRNETKIDGIRFAFHKDDMDKAIFLASQIIEKGYELYFQPMVTKNYKDIEFLSLIEKVNRLNMHSFYIVDSFGSMTLSEFKKYLILADSNLNKDIILGYHSHNNMQLAFSNAVDMYNLHLKRNIIIDASIYGMGRGAGNLNTELITNYLNNVNLSKYNILPLLEIIDTLLNRLMEYKPWGFSPAQYLSAVYNCHPNYATYLINKNTKHIVGVQKVLNKLPNESKNSFDKDLIEKLYIESFFESKTNIKGELNIPKGKKILLVASGKSIENEFHKFKQKIEDADYILIALNFKPTFECDYYFFTNQKRFDMYSSLVDFDKVMITNNIILKENINIVIGIEELISNNNFTTSITLLAIEYLILKGIKTVELIGVDGYKVDENNYSLDVVDLTENSENIESINKNMVAELKKLSKQIDIIFLTESIYKNQIKQKIVGIIPSRYGSERLPGKPLKDIEGLPMVIHVLKRAMMSEVLDELIVATDDKRIYDEVVKFGGKAMMTSIEHNNASERMFEVSKKVPADLYVMINGDEPLVNPKYIDSSIIALKNNERCGVSILYNKFYKRNSTSDFKVVINKKKEIMYISRSDIPSENRNEVENFYKAYHIVTYTQEMLEKYVKLEQSYYDKIESHELLRLLEEGYRIQGVEVESSAISVDIEKDLEIVREMMKSDSLYSLYKQG